MTGSAVFLLLQQNLGAMLRSAYCLGASGVIGCSRNCAPLSPVVSKASSGAAELMRLHSCRSMPRTLADAAEKGWAVVGAAAESASVPVSEFKVDRPTVLVMGELQIVLFLNSVCAFDLFCAVIPACMQVLNGCAESDEQTSCYAQALCLCTALCYACLRNVAA
jgi:hypothetical protein